MNSLKIKLLQINPHVGDLVNNCLKINELYQKTHSEKTHDLVVFPELSLCGYPPEDLLLRQDFQEKCEQALAQLIKKTGSTSMIIGHPHWDQDHCYNAASLIQDGKIVLTYHKQCLPNYTVFDEKRYFKAGESRAIVNINGIKAGLLICEDLWQPEPSQQLHDADILICINASPFSKSKVDQRLSVANQYCSTYKKPLLYCNLVGGQDELVFDGGSFVMDAQGEILQQAAFFNEDSLTTTITKTSHNELSLKGKSNIHHSLSTEDAVYKALCMGVHDYVKKNHFPGVVLGLSGGIDSALTLAIAVDALGHEAVEALIMPSRYTADMSNDDAIKMCETLNVKYHILSIDSLFQLYLDKLKPISTPHQPSAAQENIQARIRGNYLMYFSNASGKIVLTTGNKSELAVGYCTLYGDMAGGFSVLKDVPKTWVYKLANDRNQLSECIPQRIIDRAPSAELRADQTDQDSLPPYDILDQIIELYINQDQSIEQVIASGIPEKAAKEVAHLIAKNEYKRRQAPIGVRICDRAFGKDRRHPITTGF
jgi:NAD+ synthase (glutamine-hydrolysing)